MRSQDDSTNWSEPQKSNCLSTLKQTIYKEMIFYLFLSAYGFYQTIPYRFSYDLWKPVNRLRIRQVHQSADQGSDQVSTGSRGPMHHRRRHKNVDHEKCIYSPKGFLFFLSCYIFFQSLVASGYTAAVATSIEQRYRNGLSHGYEFRSVQIYLEIIRKKV